MMPCRIRAMYFSICLAVLVAAPGAALAQHEGDVWIGRSSGNQLKLGGFNPGLNTVALPCVNGLFQGWATNSPGFDRVVNADAWADLFPMESGAQIRIVCIAVDPAFRVINSSFAVMDAPGESMLLGNQSLHTHLTWHINSADPAFNPDQTDWFAMFKLIDTGSTAYAESAPFTFHFTNVLCPSGDVNDDGQVDGRDIQLFTHVLMDPSSATDRQRCLADCNHDCSVTPNDVQTFVDILLNT